MKQWSNNVVGCLLALALINFSCQKDNRDYKAELIQLPTELDLTDLCFISKDTGFATAGNLFTSGLILKTTNAGLHWDTLMQTAHGCNSIDYRNKQLSVSECGNKLHYSTDFYNWSYYSSDAWWRWHAHLQLENGAFILVGGGNYSLGHIHQKKSNGSKLELTDSLDFELTDIIRLENGLLQAVGYGLIMQSSDNGANWQMSSTDGDFFRAISFPNVQTGYVLGEYGSIFKTTNQGKVWQMIRNGQALFGNPSKLFRDIEFYSDTDGLIIGTNNTVMRTDNGGKTWKNIVNLVGYVDYKSIEIAYDKAFLCGNQGQLLILDLNN